MSELVHSAESITKKPRKSALRHAAAIAGFDSAPNSAHVRLPVVCALLDCSPATVWRRVQEGLIPAPKKFGPRHSAWNIGQLRASLGL